MPDVLRRLVTVVLILTLVIGVVPHGMRSANADVKMAMAAAIDDSPMSGHCDGCGDHQKAMTAAACAAYCGGFVVLPSTGAVVHLVSVEAFDGMAVPPIAGLTVPPDPHPPRSAVLS